MEPASDIRGARVWLIEPDWQARVLLRAQLLEEGWEVTAMEDWGAVKELLGEEVAAPQLLIAGLTGDEPPPVLPLLTAFPARRLVLRAAGAPEAESLRAAGIDAVLSRPCTIGDIVAAAGRLLDRPATDAARRIRVT